jgi:hypothetical protein
LQERKRQIRIDSKEISHRALDLLLEIIFWHRGSRKVLLTWYRKSRYGGQRARALTKEIIEGPPKNLPTIV